MAYICSECGSEMDRVSDVTEGPMGIPDGADFECPKCGNEEHKAVY